MSARARLAQSRPARPRGIGLQLHRRCSSCGHAAAGARCTKCRHGATPVPGIVRDVLRAHGEPLHGPVRAEMEQRFGRDFSGVRVHSDERANASAAAVDALAYTVREHVVFGRGGYAPGTPAGRALLARELTHVVQQSASNGAADGPIALSDPGRDAEREAAANAARVGRGAPLTTAVWGVGGRRARRPSRLRNRSSGLEA
jgi:hypothetical protein